MGMMNNSYFRIKVHRIIDQETGRPALKFQHPTLAGPGNFGGWFEEKSLGKQGVAVVEAPKSSVKSAQSYTMDEVAKHITKDDLWIVVKGKVYDATKYLEDHPGGAASIMISGGQDCTEEFEALHSSKAWKKLDEFLIGDLVIAATPTGTPATAEKASDLPPVPQGPPTTLVKSKYVTLPLESKQVISQDTRVFRFSLPSKEHELGLPVGQHLFIRAISASGEKVMRAYTPMGCGLGYVDFVIKVYFAGVHPRFPDGGKLTQILDKLQVGDTIDVKGPLGEYIFNTDLSLPRGLPKPPGALTTFTHTPSGDKHSFDTIGFIAGGSGITPVLQTTHALVADKSRKVSISILFANRTLEDILCKDLLDALEQDSRVKIWYTLDVPPETPWKYSTGFINEDMVTNHLPPPSAHTFIFMCGPPPMVNFACKPNLAKAGHAESNVHSF